MLDDDGGDQGVRDMNGLGYAFRDWLSRPVVVIENFPRKLDHSSHYSCTVAATTMVLRFVTGTVTRDTKASTNKSYICG